MANSSREARALLRRGVTPPNAMLMPGPPKGDTSLLHRRARQLSIGAARASGDLGDLPAYVTMEEVRAARASADPDTSALIGFLWASGARISEALAVRPMDLDIELGAARVPTLKRRRKDGSGRKTSAARVVPLPGDYLASVLAVIVRQGAQQRPDSPIWPIGRRWAWRRIRRAFERAGVERSRAHPHALRHGHAVHAVLNGVPLNLIQRQLGHASIVTTAIYLRVTAQDVREAYARFCW